MSFWRDTFSNEEIQFALGKIRQFREFSPDGNVTLSGKGEIDNWTAFLVSAIGLDIRTDALRNKIVRGILFSPALEKDFTEKSFKTIVCQLRNKYQNEETTVYKVVFSIWNKPTFLQGIKKLTM